MANVPSVGRVVNMTRPSGIKGGPNFDTLATLPNKNRNRKFTCEHVFPELTAVCPVTRLPDFYTMKLVYEPSSRLIELKSLKLYLIQYRDLEILHEELANQILDDIVRSARPRWATIELKVNVRGGVHTTVSREWRPRGAR